MSVRHVHARRGEYIKVHRHGGGSHSAGDNDGWLIGLAVIAAIVCICLFWQIILACLIGAGILWLIWVFRRPLGRALGWTGRKLWQGIQRLWQGIQRKFHKTEAEA